MNKPALRPARPYFSSGPCAKRPGWTPEILSTAVLGRSHRSATGKSKLAEVIQLSRDVLGIPADYRLGIVPASDTGAVEMALWSLLGPRRVTVLAWESFSSEWASDVAQELKLTPHVLRANYGQLPNLSTIDWSHDVVFAWNGTTSGVCVPDGEWIPADRQGLAICDATSAVFAMDVPWAKLDVVTWSWQKVLGGEAAHGMIALSPRAAERLATHRPPWPIPKIFRMAKDGKLIEGIFKGDTINTPSLLCVEDQIDALKWAQKIGGLSALIARSKGNLAALEEWVSSSKWARFLTEDPKARSNTSVCLKIVDKDVVALPAADQAKFASAIANLLEKEGVAYDIGAYREAPPGLRIWCGATVEQADIEQVTLWLDWAFAEAKSQIANKE
ncbi:phosphoserine transaminase [Dongia deserti]|uniref:phosphoserine transaminase n=1 Tax=Dongia deserti TaxID=2268030 RepID=UPI000E64A1AD|nr:phosphoserine transaminase [Dongia deserti]